MGWEGIERSAQVYEWPVLTLPLLRLHLPEDALLRLDGTGAVAEDRCGVDDVLQGAKVIGVALRLLTWLNRAGLRFGLRAPPAWRRPDPETRELSSRVLASSCTCTPPEGRKSASH